jgi:hypothetical protein
MCVAAIINNPVSLSDLRKMEDDNPHGAGVAWFEAGAIQFRRGLNAHTIFAMQQREEMTYPYLLHFRWATHGAQIPELTHPFPTGARAYSGELIGAAPQVLIHNGVWMDHDDWAPYITSEVSSKAINEGSDTSVAAYFIPHFPELADHIPWAVAVATIDAAGEMGISKHGRWYECDGNDFSNLGWQIQAKGWSMYRTAARQPSHAAWEWDTEGDYTEYATPVERAYAKKPANDVDMSDLGFDDWTDYVRARYGDELADEIRRDACKLPVAEEGDEFEDQVAREFGEMEEIAPDLISEDFTSVNTYLAQMSQEAKRAA